MEQAMPLFGSQTVNAVFEGGGVKGSALVGAIAETEARGYSFGYVAGTSAGAIVASLLAAGYTAAELASIMNDLDYQQFKDPTFLSAIPGGNVASVLFLNGVYKGAVFETWLRTLLAAKRVRTFRDLRYTGIAPDSRYRYRLQVVASDLTHGLLAVFPGNAPVYGIEPDDLDVASAVRASMSIPYFYTPVRLKAPDGVAYLVDGGILSNFPVWLYDTSHNITPLNPTIGYKLVDPEEGKPHTIRGPLTLFKALFSTMMEAHDARYIEDADFMRTVPIPTLGVQTTDFDITPAKRSELFAAGQIAAAKFFDRWQPEAQLIAQMKDAHRTERLREDAA